VKQLVAVIVGVGMTAGSALADMSFPLLNSVPARTTVMLEKPIPGYSFYAASMFEDGYIVRLRFENDGAVSVPHLHDRMVLFAVPVAVAERFPTVEALWKELREKRPDGVHTHNFDGFFFEFSLDTHRDERLEIVIRTSGNEVEFETIRRPSATGSKKVMWAGLAMAVLSIIFGIRWARRRQKRA